MSNDLKTKPDGKCDLCGAPTTNRYIGGPVGWMCWKCRQVVSKWEDRKKALHEMWKDVNQAKFTMLRVEVEKIKDEDTKEFLVGMLECVEEIVLNASVIGRIIHNMTIERRLADESDKD